MERVARDNNDGERHSEVIFIDKVADKNPDDLVTEAIESIYPFFFYLMQNKEDAEDLIQEIYLKFLQKSRKNPVWFEGIDNVKAYIVRSTINEAINIKTNIPNNIDSLDEIENLDKRELNSDKGRSISRLNDKMDAEEIRKELRKTLGTFSTYEAQLIELGFFEGCRPSLIIKILLAEHSELLEKRFPKCTDLYTQESLEIFKEAVPIDCNLAKAKFRQRIKNSILRKYFKEMK